MISWAHQPPMIEFLEAQQGAIIQGGMGIGKTYVTMEAIRGSAQRVPNVLVLCPKRGWRTWIKHTKEDLLDWRVINLCKATTPAMVKRALELVDVRTETPVPTMVLVNYERAWRKPAHGTLLQKFWTHVILDECHRVKSPTGKASKFVAVLREYAHSVGARVWGLTGTLMPNSPLDVFAQVRAVKEKPMPWQGNYYVFRKRHAVLGSLRAKGGREVQTVVGFRDLDVLADTIRPFVLRVDRDVLGMSEPVEIAHSFELNAKARALYATIERELAIQIEGMGVMDVESALVTNLRLQQLTGGYVTVDKDGEPETFQMSTEKRDALAEVLTDLEPEEPAVVFCRFKADILAVREASKAAGRDVYELSGSKDELTEWDEVARGYYAIGHPKPVLATNIKSGAESNDMTAARHAVFYSTGYEMGLIEQAKCRIDRPPRTHAVFNHYLVAAGTIDEVIVESAETKRKIIDLVVERLDAIRKKEPTARK